MKTYFDQQSLILKKTRKSSKMRPLDFEKKMKAQLQKNVL